MQPEAPALGCYQTSRAALPVTQHCPSGSRGSDLPQIPSVPQGPTSPVGTLLLLRFPPVSSTLTLFPSHSECSRDPAGIQKKDFSSPTALKKD